MPTTAVTSRWIEKRKAHWTRLEVLVAQGRRGGVAKMAHTDLRELAQLYRQVAADLSTVRERPAGAELAGYLNRLLGSAHNVIYTAPPARLAAVAGFFTRTFPRVFRETWRYSACALLLFISGAVVGSALTATDPGFARFVLGGEMMDTISRGQMWTHSILSVKPVASSAILTSNISVSFSAFAMGMLGGIGTIYLMVFNGLLIGVIGTACHAAGMSVSLWSFVAPHGSLELPAIFIAGGAGLLLGRGVLFPGSVSRRQSLADAAALAIRLVLGVVPILVVAGIVEGFISPTDIPVPLKFVTSAALGVLLALYLTLAGTPSAAGVRPER